MEEYDWREALDAYRAWTQAQHDEQAEHARRQARITRARAVALAAMASLGMSTRQIADVTGLSHGRVGQLIALVAGGAQAPAEPAAPTR
jgi:DNA-binding CsgD family transcriptional regulator